jgi:hypothetical protein
MLKSEFMFLLFAVGTTCYLHIHQQMLNIKQASK